MKRNGFLKLCAAGACGCCASGFLAPLSAQTQSGQAQLSTVPAESEIQKVQFDRARERFASLISIMGEYVDNTTRDNILRKLGHECAQEGVKLFEKYRSHHRGQGVIPNVGTAKRRQPTRFRCGRHFTMEDDRASE